MKMNHLNLVVTDVGNAVRIFEQHMGFKCLENRKDAIAVLTNEDRFVLIFWSAKLNKTASVNYPENFHVGFYQQDKEGVIEMYNKLYHEEMIFESEPRKLRDTFGFYCYLDQLMIEVSVRPT